MVLEMMMESIFVVADVFFVGRLGPDAVATVGITESLMTVMYALAIGLSIGAAATVARRVGEKDLDSAGRSAVQSVLMGLGAAAIFGTIGILFGPRLLALMGASDDVLKTGSTFARVMLGGSGTVVLLFLINAVFRGAGDAAIAMRVLWFANAINIILGPCLIFGIGPFPELGVTGAAVGTTIGRGSGVLYQLFHLSRQRGRLQVRRAHLKFDFEVMRTILRISGTATFQNFIGTASWMGLVRILTGFGSAAVAGNTIGIRIILFALLPSFGVSNAAATLVGQNLGAKKPERAEAAAWKAGMYNTICLGTVGAFTWGVFPYAFVLHSIALLALPVGTAVAILKYRLYELDLVVNRALVYGVMSVGVVAAYVIVVGLIGTQLSHGGSLVLSLALTGVVAVAFQPVRERVQRFVNERMYGERDDPYAVISRLGRRLADAVRLVGCARHV